MFCFKSADITHFYCGTDREQKLYTVKNDNQLSPVLGRKSGMSLIKTLAGKTFGLSSLLVREFFQPFSVTQEQKIAGISKF
jgi:hypothetical protein